MPLNTSDKLIREGILPYLPHRLQDLLQYLKEDDFENLEEIRLRCGQPLALRLGEREVTLDAHGRLSVDLGKGVRITRDDIWRMVASVSDNSLYAFEEDVRRGFITIPGGHRVGLAGHVTMDGQKIRLMKDFGSICFRVARQVAGCAASLYPRLFDESGNLVNTLVVSPPRCGKTTLLRDLARLISEDGKRPGKNVVIVDERSEIAGCYMGVPQLDVGPRTDILDGCPKDIGMMMAIRSLSPQVIITDEIGQAGDAQAMLECIKAGVAVIASAHANQLDQLRQRPYLKDIMQSEVFPLVVLLSRRGGPGTMEQIVRWDHC